MNSKQIKTLWAGIALFALMCLFPPWIGEVRYEGQVAVRHRCYAFIGDPPKERTAYSNFIFYVDVPRLFIQCLVMAVVTGGLLVSLKNTGRKAPLEAVAQPRVNPEPQPQASFGGGVNKECMSMGKYHIAVNGKQSGPFEESEVLRQIAAGVLSPNDLCWREGMADWQPIDAVLNVASLKSSPSSPAQPAHDASTEAAPAKLGPTGVGGWLTLFCVGLTILGPLVSLGQMRSVWEQAEPVFARFPSLETVIYFENFGIVLILLYGFLVGWKIWGGNPSGKRLAKQYLLIRLFGLIGVEGIALLLSLNLPAQMIAGVVEGVLGGLLGEGIFFLVWWLYFMKSKRVRNTYED